MVEGSSDNERGSDGSGKEGKARCLFYATCSTTILTILDDMLSAMMIK